MKSKYLLNINEYFPDKTFPVVAFKDGTPLPYRRFHLHFKTVEIQYAVKGEGVYFAGKKPYTIKEGSVLIIHQNEIHRLVNVSSKNPLEKISILLNPEALKYCGEIKNKMSDFFFKCESFFPHLISFKQNNMEIDYIFRSIWKTIKQRTVFWKESTSALLVLLFTALQKQLSQNRSKDGTQKTDAKIQQAMDFIDDNLLDEISLDTIADNVGLASSYLSFRFKQVLGFNIKDYIIAKRINEARRKLEELPNEKIITIAYNAGFKDLSHFNHTFRRITGFTPSDYRKLLKA